MDSFNNIIKNNWGQIVALLSNYLKDIDLAEDATQDAVESALIHWKKNGVPVNPKAWLFTTAKHKALDKIRRAKKFSIKQEQYQILIELNSSNYKKEDVYIIPDERLRLIFTCCHSALDSSVAIALTLRLLGGLTTQEIAKAFLVKTETMAQRLVRGKKKIKQAAIPYVIPEEPEFTLRLATVLKVLYLIFNEGYSASSGDIQIRHDLSKEAIRMTRILLNLCPQQPEVKGLLALMLLHDSRRLARYNPQGMYVPLDNQDRKLWLSSQIQEGVDLVQSALKQQKIGSYQLQATISAIHAEAEDYPMTNWDEIVLVYDELLKLNPSDVIRLNRLVAVSQVQNLPDVLIKLNQLENSLIAYQPFYAVKADILVKLGNIKQAKYYYKKAIELSENLQVEFYLKSQCLKLS